jgi:type IV pilus assembly protein PilV
MEVKMQHRMKSQNGFSMIELLVAVVILAVGLLGLAELQITALKANSQSQTIMAATSLAQQVLEEVTALEADDGIFDGTVGNWGDGSPITVEGGGTYNVTYNIVKNYEGVTDLCQISIQVQSTTKLQNVLGKQVRTVSMSTLRRTQ